MSSPTDLRASLLTDLQAPTFPMSPISEIYLASWGTAAGIVAPGAGVIAGDLAVEALELFDSFVGVGGELAQAVPLLGQIFGAVMGIATLAQDAEAQKKAAAAQRCREQFDKYPVPVGSGSAYGACVKCPADIFAPLYSGPAPSGYQQFAKSSPSLLGAAWIKMTEWFPYGARGKDTWAGREMAYNSFAFGHGYALEPPSGEKLGPIQKLRMAMGVQYSVKGDPKPGTDGGASLWPLYLDAVLDLFRSRNLDWNFVEYMMPLTFNSVCESTDDECVKTGKGAKMSAGPDPMFKDCAAELVSSIRQTIDGWVYTVEPNYADGLAGLNEAKGILAEIAANPAPFRARAPKRRQAKRNPVPYLLAGGAAAGGIGYAVSTGLAAQWWRALRRNVARPL